uniref:hypothetical protein n=1 Tax=Pseudactinotalea sp. TaxID=1926260 RepID=UPI003B3B7068
DKQPRYPFEHHVADAIEVLDTFVRTGRAFGRRVKAVHTSPPCQKFTAYRRRGAGVGDGYLNLIPDVRERLEQLDVPWVIENVETARAELIDPVMLCGSSFGLDVRRHRLFESNIPLTGPACDHSWQTPRFPPATNRTNLRRTVEVGVWRIPLDVQRKAMGIDWMELRELSEALPPAYTEYIGRQLIDHLKGAV